MAMNAEEMLALILQMQRQAEQDRAETKARFEEEKRQAEQDRAEAKARFEEEKRQAKQTERRAKQTECQAKQAQKQVGDLMRKYGLIVESLVEDGTAQKLARPFTGPLERILTNVSFHIDNSKISDIDRIFVYEKAIIIVDIKSKYRVQDLDKLRTELLPPLVKDTFIHDLCRRKDLYIAIAALDFAESRVKTEAAKAGYYVLKILNENSKIESDPNFKPKAIKLENKS